jgi:hypothetical protein
MRAAEILTGCTSFLQWTAAGVAVEACAGAVMGVAYGAATGLLLSDVAAGVRVFVHVTSCAAAAGAIVGAFIRLSDGCNPLATERTSRVSRRRPRPGAWAVLLRDRLGGNRPRGLGTEQGPFDPSWN